MTLAERLRQLSPDDLAALGIAGVAYVKAVTVDDATGYAVHAADGRQIGILPTREAALAAMREHGLEPVSLH